MRIGDAALPGEGGVDCCSAKNPATMSIQPRMKAKPSAAPVLEVRPPPLDVVPAKARPAATPVPPAYPPTPREIRTALVRRVQEWQRLSKGHTQAWCFFVRAHGSTTFDPHRHEAGTLSEFLGLASTLLSMMMKGNGKGQFRGLWQDTTSQEPPMKGNAKGKFQGLWQDTTSPEPPKSKPRLTSKPRLRTPPRKSKSPADVAAAASSHVTAAVTPPEEACSAAAEDAFAVAESSAGDNDDWGDWKAKTVSEEGRN